MAKVIPFETIVQQDLEVSHPNLWATVKGNFPDLGPAEWEKICSISLGLCPICRDSHIGCQCHNDE